MYPAPWVGRPQQVRRSRWEKGSLARHAARLRRLAFRPVAAATAVSACGSPGRRESEEEHVRHVDLEPVLVKEVELGARGPLDVGRCVEIRPDIDEDAAPCADAQQTIVSYFASIAKVAGLPLI